MKHFICCIVILLAASLLSSCVLLPIPEPKDIRVVSLKIVRLEQDEISRNMLYSAIFNLSELSECKIFKSLVSRSLISSNRENKDFICVTLETGCDLIKMTKRHELNLGCDGRFIDPAQASDDYFPLTGSVFDGDICVHLGNKSLEHDLSSLAKQNFQSPLKYQVYFRVRGEYTPGHINSRIVRHYDLRRDPQSIECFLGAVDMLGRPFETNHVIIPADLISACLAKK